VQIGMHPGRRAGRLVLDQLCARSSRPWPPTKGRKGRREACRRFAADLLRVNSDKIMIARRPSSTADRLNMPLLGVGQKLSIARH